MNDIEKFILKREMPFFEIDFKKFSKKIEDTISVSSFLVIGGAGSIGQSVVKEIFLRKPKKLVVIDIDENGLVELVRDIRSSIGYIEGIFELYVIDVGSIEFDLFVKNSHSFDYVLNLSAMKHVRNEKDPYALMRMVKINVINTRNLIKHATALGAKKFFCVSSDKASNPVNLMGATKRIMEYILWSESNKLPISSARFANVLFSNGSLTYSFNKRIEKKQPIVIPNNIKRYFISTQEAGLFCLFSTIIGENKDIFFPKASKKIHLITFKQILEKYLDKKGLKPLYFSTELEARQHIFDDKKNGFWPCFISETNTAGEKSYEEFFTSIDTIDESSFKTIGKIIASASNNKVLLEKFLNLIDQMLSSRKWTLQQIIDAISDAVPEMEHKTAVRTLYEKM